MRRRSLFAAVLALGLPVELMAQEQSVTLYRSPSCPIPDWVTPYTIVARYDGARTRDSIHFRRLANRVGAHFHGIPSSERRVSVEAVLRRDGSGARTQIADGSGDKEFDRRALEAVRGSLKTGRVAALPADVGEDTLSVLFLFGEPPLPSDFAVRCFSRQWHLPRLRSDSVLVSYAAADPEVSRRKGEVVTSTMVDTAGAPSAEAARVLRTTDEALGLVARQLVPRLRFEPGQSDCELQSYEVLVRFVFDGLGLARVRTIR